MSVPPGRNRPWLREIASSRTASGMKNDGSHARSKPSGSSKSWIVASSEIRDSRPAAATLVRAIASDGFHGSSPTTVDSGNVEQNAMANPRRLCRRRGSGRPAIRSRPRDSKCATAADADP